MIFYCTNGWHEMTESVVLCPRCGDDIPARNAQADYVDKLMAALRHREPSKQIRAAWVLERVQAKAVERWVDLIQESSDPCIVKAALEDLGKISNWRAGCPSGRTYSS